MFSTLRTRFGIPGVISVIALVFAMFGGAYAASNSSDGGKATASAKAKQGPRGKTGKTGPAGPAGPQGPAGPKGDSGANGSNGSNGADGKSVVLGVAGANCTTPNGTSVEVAGSGVKQYVCNGKNGTNGTTGFTETLPSGKTETGAWGGVANTSETLVGLSFSIPLAAPLDAAHALFHGVNYNGEDEAQGEHELCPGTASNPKAKEGYLCVYTGAAEGGAIAGAGVFDPSTTFGTEGAAKSGATLFVVGPALSAGTWAVTAP